MKLTLNREFAVRHLGVALLMAALSAWFFYDGAITYPRMSDAAFKEKILHNLETPDFAAKRRQMTNRQFQFSALAALAALIIAGGVWRVKRQTLSWDESSMTGSLTGGKPLAFSEIVRFDASKWEKKGILTIHAQDGRHVTLDTWHHAGAKELALRLKSDLEQA